ncbi:unnamed protein product (macronuclear) [Paramecium tetraurelia]|uniref:Protein kinase domain-containing protein n=1 Tax=Paramecium tetraurelia TaxID=5888 RepID=A0E860_PARTE|nr:uncharacterized protein GSPATT00024205001 [Paramecium tetraurelia]CAK91477.1 unnamed protein product [Paramecium tetraurelia]|eukprot:XP_001458874.1 hypothetical protein (macronuclear) [Paramecium tetraurelia strain d4-2]
MYCTRKHLLFDKSYIITLNQDSMNIGESTQHTKYTIALKLQTVIDWKISQEDFQLVAFCIDWKNKQKYFYADQSVLLRVKNYLAGRVIFKNIDYFYKQVGKIETRELSSVYTIQGLDNNVVYVCKELNRQKLYSYELFQNEVETLGQLTHQNIVKLIEAYTKETSYLIVLEFLKGGTLSQCLKYCRMSIMEIEIITRQILEALCYLHERGFVHRDIKPENILFCELGQFCHLKLIDFGISCKIKDLSEDLQMTFGTPGYIAPEILQRKNRRKISQKIDVFSCGAIIYYMLTGAKLIFGINQQELCQNNKVYTLNYQILQNVKQKNFRDLLSKMITEDPDQRIDARQALNYLKLMSIPTNTSLSISLQSSQDHIQELPNFKKLIAKN